MDTAHARQVLEVERGRLEKEIGWLGRPVSGAEGVQDWTLASTTAEVEPDILDQAELATGRAEDAAVLANLEGRCANVMSALKRIEAGTYGQCEVCGKTIEEKRLAADPAALSCLEHR